MTQKEISARFYRRRLEQGLCPRCGSEKPEGGFYCDECREKQRNRNRKNRAFARQIGICPSCLKNKVFGDEKQCIDCREYHYSHRAIFTEEQRQKHNEKQSIYHRQIHSERLEGGMCTRCGRRKAEEGKKKCKMCLVKDAEYHRSRYEGKRQDREEKGLCIRCGSVMDRKGKICLACVEKCKPKTTYDRKKHIWHEMNGETFRKRCDK